jgi:hypothetical protein
VRETGLEPVFSHFTPFDRVQQMAMLCGLLAFFFYWLWSLFTRFYKNNDQTTTKQKAINTIITS